MKAPAKKKTKVKKKYTYLISFSYIKSGTDRQFVGNSITTFNCKISPELIRLYEENMNKRSHITQSCVLFVSKI